MPTYEYECDDCGKRVERFQQITARPLRKCPSCGGHLKRLFGAGGAILVRGSSSREASSCPYTSSGSTCCGLASPCGEAPCDG